MMLNWQIVGQRNGWTLYQSAGGNLIAKIFEFDNNNCFWCYIIKTGYKDRVLKYTKDTKSLNESKEWAERAALH